MVKCFKLYYSTKKYQLSEFNTSSPTPGKIYLFELDAKDDHNNTYRLHVNQSAIIPDQAQIVSQPSNYAIYSLKEPSKLLAYITFVIPTYVSSGDFVPGEYYSSNGSKIIIDQSDVRKLCVRL